MAEKMIILETPRDAFQGLNQFIPTKHKIEYYQSLLSVGYDILDIGSLASTRIIPQFKDIEVVIDSLDLSNTNTAPFLLVLTENGGKRAVEHSQLKFIGYPFSTSETFLHKNIKSNFEKSWKTIEEIQQVAVKSGKEFLVYISMAFGNPYGDPVDLDHIMHWVEKLNGIGIRYISLSDIIGNSEPDFIGKVYKEISNELPEVISGVHLHINPAKGDWKPKLKAAADNGCKMFDSVMSGMGGCPMTGYEMLGNLPTQFLLQFAKENNLETNIDQEAFQAASKKLNEIINQAQIKTNVEHILH